MSESNSSYINEIGGDLKGIVGNIQGGIVNQYIITQYSRADIHSRKLKSGSPYLGLNKFEPGDKDKFFGREQSIIKLSHDLEKNNLLFLLGASGSGKSSLVQAGLIPYLSDQWGASQLVTMILMPDRNPFLSFFDSFPKKMYKEKVSELFADNQQNNLTLINAIKRCKEEFFKWIIFIDQFEELFTRTPKLEREKFIASLISLIQEPDASINLILAMRSDFLDDIQVYADLTNEVEKQIRLTRDMTEIELRLAIAEPAARNGVTFEKGLVEQIIHDFYRQAGSLPLLQYTLDLLWREDKPSENNRVLNIETYESIGRVSGALQKQADHIFYEELNDQERKAAKKVFIELIDLKAKEPISRRIEQSQLKSDKAIYKVLEKLIDNRLVVSGRYKSTIEVAHEELLRSWRVFQELIQEKEEVILLRSRLFGDVQQWIRLKKEDNEKAKTILWTGYNLENFHNLVGGQELSDFDEESRNFIRASDERQMQLDNEEEEKRNKELQLERTKNRLLLTLTGVSILSLVAVILGWIAWQGKDQERLLELSIDLHNGLFESKTIDLLPKLIKKGDEYQKKGGEQNIERAMSSYRDVLDLTSLAQKRTQDDIAANPAKYKNFLETGVEDIRKYSRDEESIVKIREIEKEASSLLTQLINEYRIPQLEKYLRDKQYGEKLVGAKPSEFEFQFTEGAIQETYRILVMDVGTDINRSGYIGNEEEAQRMPENIVLEIERLWRDYTNQKCGWFGSEYQRKAPECNPLKGSSLSSLIFYGPSDAQKVISDYLEQTDYPNPVSDKCVQQNILEARESLYKLGERSSSRTKNSLKISSGSGQITDSQYPQLIPIGIRMDLVAGSYDPYNRQMTLEISGRLLELYLFEPLSDNKKVEFIVKKIRRNENYGSMILGFLPPYYISIERDFVTKGTLQKVDNQIKGDFNTEGEIWLGEFTRRYKGFINGEFTLNIESGQKAEIPSDYEYGRVLTSIVEDCLKVPISSDMEQAKNPSSKGR